MNTNFATAFALSAAALFVGCGKEQPASTSPGGADAAPAPASDGAALDEGAVGTGPEVKCLGINECAGESACDVAGSHDCGGQNSCKGKGWILVPQEQCDSKGGTVI